MSVCSRGPPPLVKLTNIVVICFPVRKSISRINMALTSVVVRR